MGSQAATVSAIFEEEAENFIQKLMAKVSAEGKATERKREAGLNKPYLDPSLRESPRKYAEFCRMLAA